MPEVTIIGCGVSGLSSAVLLQTAGFDVNIIAREEPQFTTSVAAGAVWYGGGALGKAREWAEITLEHFQALAEHPNTGVKVVRLREVFPHGYHIPWYRDLLPYFEHIPKNELPPERESGFIMDIPIVEPPKYLNYLYNRYQEHGGKLEIREIKMIDEVKYESPIIVNCTGVWAREIADDPKVFPIRGQTLVIEAPDITEGYMDDYSFTYLFPREDGVLIGGVAEPNIWDLESDAGLTADIVARCSQIDSKVAQVPILKQYVGLRPGRDRVRLEAEILSQDCTVIHNYGHAGVGYTLSWGCAGEVTTLARNIANF